MNCEEHQYNAVPVGNFGGECATCARIAWARNDDTTCAHERVSTYRSEPPRSVCLDCMDEVRQVWTTVGGEIPPPPVERMEKNAWRLGCPHDWMLRPESDTYECLICGDER